LFTYIFNQNIVYRLKLGKTRIHWVVESDPVGNWLRTAEDQARLPQIHLSAKAPGPPWRWSPSESAALPATEIQGRARLVLATGAFKRQNPYRAIGDQANRGGRSEIGRGAVRL